MDLDSHELLTSSNLIRVHRICFDFNTRIVNGLEKVFDYTLICFGGLFCIKTMLKKFAKFDILV